MSGEILTEKKKKEKRKKEKKNNRKKPTAWAFSITLSWAEFSLQHQPKGFLDSPKPAPWQLSILRVKNEQTLCCKTRWVCRANKYLKPVLTIIIMYIYHALINALNAHMIHINLNMIFYTHVEHSPIKTLYIKYYTHTHTHTYTHTHTHTQKHYKTHTMTVAETGYWYWLGC